jgi:hypothetical protein
MRRNFHRWTRDLHLYVGLFVSPLVLLYALSVIVINHVLLPRAGAPAPPGERRSVFFDVRDDTSNLTVAKAIRDQIGITGEIVSISRAQRGRLLNFAVQTPRSITSVRADLDAGAAQVERSEQGLAAALVYLHKMPGPHNANIRGNWAMTQAWRWVANGTVYLILFVTASGIYLWLVLRAERRWGLLCLAAGTASFIVLVTGLVA